MGAVGYVTITDADEYVAARYVSTDPNRLRWEALSDADKEVYLLRSVEAIDCLPFTGRPTQLPPTELAPLWPDPSKGYPGNVFGTVWPRPETRAFPRWPSNVVPTEVRHAQIENALALSNSAVAEEADEYSLMRLYGVERVRLGHFEESLTGKVETPQAGIVSGKTMQLLKQFMGGGYRIG